MEKFTCGGNPHEFVLDYNQVTTWKYKMTHSNEIEKKICLVVHLVSEME